MKKFLIWFITIIGLLIIIFRMTYPSYSWNQKTNIVVQTPSGLKSGSGVVYIKWSDGPKILPDPPKRTYSYEGEAAILDLGDGKYLFALISDAERLGLKVFGGTTYSQFTDMLGPSIKTTHDSKGNKNPILVEHMPRLVTFDDISDPTTVKQVDPSDLAATFGAGYSLKSITLEITDEKVTQGEVDKVLGWLNELNGGYLHGGFTSKGAPLGLHGGAFKTGK